MQSEPYSVRELTIRELKSSDGSAALSEHLRPRWASPTNIIAIISCAISIGLLIWAALLRDGVAVVGIIIMSSTAPVLCAGARYKLPKLRLALMSRDGDVVFRTRDGIFTVIHCTESIARLLYFSPEAPEFSMNIYANRLSGGVVGGLMLIVSITLFSNCTWTMQAALSVTYALLNVLYWVAAVLPERYSWDFSNLEISEKHTFFNANFAEGLWVAIQRSGSIDWVRASRSVPDTPVWSKWLLEADQRLQSNSKDWQPRKAFEDLSSSHRVEKPRAVWKLPESV
ncbi:unnamed protein product [Cercospora beticola]|nr:unnamed protein product [Cercospora beticola]